MKKQVLISFISILLFTACKKAEKSTCNYKGTIAFNCRPGAPGTYAGYIDNQLIRDFVGGQYGLFQQDTGMHILKAVGSGINYQDTVHLKPCETITYNFPD